jgi:hypothetical protein
VSDEFNVFAWSMAIPLCDDLWLGMKARNIAIIDQGYLRPLELEVLQEMGRNDTVPLHLSMALGGLSEMWVFYLYEFLRTWRKKAEQIIKLADQYERTKPAKRAKLNAANVEAAKGKEKFTHGAISSHSEDIARIGDPTFVKAVKDYYNGIEGLFSCAEALRVTLAKHEVPKSAGLIAESPGYARLNMMVGSHYWHFVNKEGGLERLDRRELANMFLGIDEDIEMSGDGRD